MLSCQDPREDWVLVLEYELELEGLEWESWWEWVKEEVLVLAYELELE